ncbi:MAG: carboxypeptidase M32 [Alphaproteobacteria bacterium]|nr:carboxypeptidase M32 [Alphaproteobacteria bacterium]
MSEQKAFSTNSSYEALTDRFRRASLIGDALGILDWDQATTMPEGSAEGRAEQIATLSVMRHELLVDSSVGENLLAAQEAFQDADAESWDAANLREMQRSYAYAAAVPGDLVEAAARANAVCEIKWRGARAANDFASLVPALQTVIDRVGDIAQARSEAFELDPYDALLDEFEAGTRVNQLDPLFGALARDLPGFVEEVLAHQASKPAPVLPDGPFPVAIQRALATKLMDALGFDFGAGRLDISHHPFCGGAAGDVRITTRYSEEDFTESLMGVLHETGHALYEAGLPELWRYQPVGKALGMAIHESQSLLIEMQVSRSRPFLEFAMPHMQAAFGADGTAWEVENFYRLYTRVERGFIRVDADEVTYPLHVVLRYRLERALLFGDLPLGDLPGAWNDGMRDLLGIAPPDDRLGCLQDVHWPSGAFGYFPTYTLGAMAAAQLYGAAQRDLPNLAEDISAGQLSPLIGWLRTHVHGQGSFCSAEELLTAATGEPLNPQVFLDHLRHRYLGDA